MSRLPIALAPSLRTDHATVLATLLALAWGPVHAQSCFNAQVAPTTPTADFGVRPDGTAIHQPTGLQWMRCSLGQVWTGTTCSGTALGLPVWATALQTVRSINAGTSDADGDGAPGFAGFTDWRVPNIKELVSIAEACRRNPALNNVVFPNTPSLIHWSSSTPHTLPTVAWYMDGGEAVVSFTLKSDSIPRYVKLVRGGAGAGGYVAGTSRLLSNGFEPQ